MIAIFAKMKAALLFLLIIYCKATEAASIKPIYDPKEEVTFNLFTKENPKVAQILKYGDANSIAISNFMMDNEVKLIVHGWRGSGSASIITIIRDAFLANLDVNVIIVDWESGAAGEEEIAVSNAPLVGTFLASFIDWISELGVSFDKVHLIGHSLGGQVVGVAGRSCVRGKVSYLSALDPARKFWENTPNNLNRGDAKYVEVMHTDIESAALIQPVGHTDFYPNKGSNMPGCTPGPCSHLRACEYFADSIDHDGFMADECASYEELISGNCSNLSRLHMGGSSPKNATGVFYLETNAQKPFYKG